MRSQELRDRDVAVYGKYYRSYGMILVSKIQTEEAAEEVVPGAE